MRLGTTGDFDNMLESEDLDNMFEGEDGVDRRVRAKSLLECALQCCARPLPVVYLLIAICVELVAGKGHK